MLTTLKNRDFRIYWVGALISFGGTWLQITAFSWLVRSLTPSPLMLGMVAFCSSLPMFAFSLFCGVFADRLDKRKAILWTQAALAVLAALLAYLVISETVQLAYVFVIAFASGTAAALDAPLRQSIVYDLVGKEDLTAAIALNSVGFNSARIAGPAIAGILIAKVGTGICFLINSISFLAVILAMLLVRVDTRPVQEAAASVWSDFLSGVWYMKSHRTILGLMLMIAAPSLFALPYQTLLPIFAKDILGVGAASFGAMLSATGIGALTGALVLTTLGKIIGKGRTMLIAALLLGTSLSGLAFTTSFAVALGFLGCIGFGTVIYIASTNSLLQSLSSNEMRGRVVGAYIFMFLGLSPIGNLIVGGLAQGISPQWAVATGGFLVSMMAAGIWLRRPDIKLL